MSWFVQERRAIPRIWATESHPEADRAEDWRLRWSISAESASVATNGVRTRFKAPVRAFAFRAR